jgi:hypothetical protein
MLGGPLQLHSIDVPAIKGTGPAARRVYALLPEN